MKKNLEILKVIRDKISKLRNLDKNYTIFGSEVHKYKFGREISEDEINEFEVEHNIVLQKSYREFILEFGDGCCGPNYGLMMLDSSILDTPQYPQESAIINLSSEFRFSSAWNLDFVEGEDEIEWEKKYENVKWCDGMMRISHEGCGIFSNLVISGQERGNIWTDERASDGGIYPFNHHKGITKTNFLDWYVNWLDISLSKFLS